MLRGRATGEASRDYAERLVAQLAVQLSRDFLQFLRSL